MQNVTVYHDADTQSRLLRGKFAPIGVDLYSSVFLLRRDTCFFSFDKFVILRVAMKILPLVSSLASDLQKGSLRVRARKC